MMRKIRIQDNYPLSQVQENADEAFKELPFNFPVIKGNFIEASIATSDTFIEHKLSKSIKGWFIVRKNGNADVWESTTSNLRPKDQIILKASTAVDVTVYFF
jgi:hypothetical protein